MFDKRRFNNNRPEILSIYSEGISFPANYKEDKNRRPYDYKFRHEDYLP